MSSIYTNISKQLGWDPRTVEFPTLEHAKELSEKASTGDRDAFYEIFKFNRFLTSPETPEQEEVCNEIYKAFNQHSHLFR